MVTSSDQQHELVVKVTVRLSAALYDRVIAAVGKNSMRYDGVGHYIRCALIEKLRKQGGLRT